MKGFVKIFTCKVGQDKVLHCAKSNLVVNSSREIIANLVQSGGTSTYRIQEFKGGSGIHGGSVSNPGPPDIDDTDLQIVRFTGSIDGYTIFGSPYDHLVTIDFSMGTGDGNGFTYTEFGLFTDTGAPDLMFSEITFPGIPKDNTVEIFGEWTIALIV